MTPTQEAAMRHALEALGKLVVGSEYEDAIEAEQAITALRAALAEPPVQEPVAWRFQSAVGGWAYGSQPPLGSKYPAYPLYAAPPQRKPLTTEEVERIWFDGKWSGRPSLGFVRAIERAHNITE